MSSLNVACIAAAEIVICHDPLACCERLREAPTRFVAPDVRCHTKKNLYKARRDYFL